MNPQPSALRQDAATVGAGRDATALRAFFRLVGLWGLTMEQARVLLGRPSRATLYNWRAGRAGTLPYDTLRRISYLLGICKAVEILYSDPQLADSWIKRRNVAFGGQSALDRMLAGDVADLAAVRSHLDAARGGWS